MDQMGIHYNIWIVLLSFALAATAAYSALNLISQVSHSTGRVRRLWLLSGACVLGSGIWAMHFVGIMASHLPFKVSYHPGTAVLSLLVSMLSCYAALQIATASRQRMWRFLIGGVILGGGISLMHYIGMSSMEMEAKVHYEIKDQALSVLIALLASYIGVFMFRKFKDYRGFSRWKLYSALFIALAVTGMHYTSLTTSHLQYDNWLGTKPVLMEADVILLTGISLVTLFMLALSGGAVFLTGMCWSVWLTTIRLLNCRTGMDWSVISRMISSEVSREPCSSSTWTASNPLMIRSDMISATCCCGKYPNG